MSDLDEQRKMFLTIMDLSGNKLRMLDLALRCAEVSCGEKQTEILRTARQHLDEVMDWTRSIYAHFHAVPDGTVLIKEADVPEEEAKRVH